MKDHILEFLHANFAGERKKESAWKHLNDLFLIDESNIELWNAYRTLQVKFSQDGRHTDITSELLDQIENLKNQVSRLTSVKEKFEKKLAKETEVYLEYRKVA
jgi:site-specific DNA-adenine methylase